MVSIRSRCSRRLDGQQCDGVVGAIHGRTMLPIDWMEYNDLEGLARLSFPAELEATREQYVLHPSMLHGAIVATIAFALIQDGKPRQIRFPYALQQLLIYGAVPRSAYVHVRESEGAGRGGKVRKYDLDVVDESGRCALALRGFTAVAGRAPGSSEVVYARPVWQEQALAGSAAGQGSGERPVFVLGRADAAVREVLQRQWREARIEELAPVGADRARAIEENFLKVMGLLQGCLGAGEPRQAFVVLVEEEEGSYLHAALGGLLRTAQMESGKLLCKLVRYAREESAAGQGWVERLRAELNGSVPQVEVRLSAAGRQVRRWEELALGEGGHACEVVRAGNVVWITGGLGGLGRIVARQLGAVAGVRVVASGRSELQGEQLQALRQLRAEGIEIDYLRGDVSDGGEVAELLEQVQRRFGQLSGIVHCAGVTRDAYLMHKTAEQVQAVLRPKVAGVLALDEATRQVPLQFMVLFSSLAAGGNAGQADYAGANAFLDEFAHYRNEQVRRGQRSGRTLSVNWPLWREGGMQVAPEVQELNERVAGLRALETATGMGALVAALREGHTQVLVAAGEVRKLRAVLLQGAGQVGQLQKPQRSSPEWPQAQQSAARGGARQQGREQSAVERMVQELQGIAGELAKLESQRIDAQAELSRYGFDSIMLTEFANELNRRYALELMPTVFFECPTLQLLGEYLVKQHGGTLRSSWEGQRPESAPKGEVARIGPEQIGQQRRAERTGSVAPGGRRRAWAASVPAGWGARKEPIAVVGMSGRFPGSADLKGLWENVAANRDLIGEVPAERWDWRKCYGDPQSMPDKTRVKTGGFMADVDRFDPLFFGISPLEAQGMDPQQRLFIETVWACIEDAGYRPSSLSGTRTGVFVGISTADYKDLVHRLRVLGLSHSQGSYLFHFMAANRVSYLLNLRGPSEPIDTACSSSLVAIHRAVGCLRSGECEAALIGGVNVIASPDITIGASQAGMLSEDGRCKSFDKSADGYGRGEGVAALYLKPLGRAERDGDHIYGLICGSAENHGGKASSPTAPNPLAQQELIVAAYRDAGIDVRTVGYIETHGTGTVLGDPIEFNGLKAAFAQLCAEQGAAGAQQKHCGLGSLKTNIGHLEAAAGVAGVIKVLLMLKHGKIPGNAHLKEPNPYLQLEDSPFYLVRETHEWRAGQDGHGRAVPRRAGVSSFGVGGANAHVVIEEYARPAPRGLPAPTGERPALMVLSARSEERLREQAVRLLAEVSGGSYGQEDLPQMAYTLQAGREAMEHRLAFTASTIEQLQKKLRQYVAGSPGRERIEECYSGQVPPGAQPLSRLQSDEEFAETLEKWIQRGKHARLLELWAHGLNVDWSALYSGLKPRRLSLPTYPFAGERYWIETASGGQRPARAKDSVVHPLLQRNTSDLVEQRFTSELTGEEFFLADHVVKGNKILPAAAFLEMARAAVVASLSAEARDQALVQLKDVAWHRPLVANEGREVHVALSAHDDGDVEFEVYTTRSNGADREDVVHAQGRAAFTDRRGEPDAIIDLASLRAKCTRSIDVERLYEAADTAGITFGAAHRALTNVQLGMDAEGRQFVIARVGLPECVRETIGHYVLHPSVLDGAMQATIGLAWMPGEMVGEGGGGPSLPFALESLQVLGGTPEVALVYVRASKPRATQSASQSLRRLDIDICDEAGEVCVRLRGLSSRALEGERLSEQERTEGGTLLLARSWQSKPLRGDEEAVQYGRRRIFVDAAYAGYLGELGLRWPSVRWEVLPGRCEQDEAAGEQLAAAGEQLLGGVQELLRERSKQAVLVQVLVQQSEAGEEAGAEALRALSGLLRSASQENPQLRAQMIGVPAGATPGQLAEVLEENARAAGQGGEEIRYVQGRREVLSWKELSEAPGAAALGLPWRDGGVYLITGGGGGLGLLFAQEIVQSVRGATVILSGRSALGAAQQSQLERLRQRGLEARLQYRVMDVTDAQAVQDCVQELLHSYERVDGIIHCAGVIRDNFIIKKSAQEFRAVLAPKVAGVINLDRATRESGIEFLVLFSSAAGVTGNVGQSDYATANAYLDWFASYRNALVRQDKRRGQTLSINWPLWAEGGMGVEAGLRAQMQQAGYEALGSEAGKEAFYRALRSSESQVLVVSGRRAKLEELRGSVAGAAGDAAATGVERQGQDAAGAVVQVDRGTLREKTIQYLKRLLAGALKVPVERVEAQAALEQYGIDSI
ncbi:MAG: SDR family NAD(P)-dependent oxidoreductase, partial [Steroidobacteraceae bacterium]